MRQELGVQGTSFLNLFRGVAALWVVIGHCLLWGGPGLLPFPSPKLAVDLFMVLSGFLMVFTVDRSSAGWRQFYLRRFFRIAPGYYVALAAMILLSSVVIDELVYLQSLDPRRWGEGGVYDPRLTEFGVGNVLFHVSFLFGLHPDYGFTSLLPDWSLSLEMQFYAAFPLIYLAARRSKYAPWLIALPALYYAHLYRGSFSEPSFLPLKLTVFVVGMMIHDKRIWEAFALLFLASIPLTFGHALLFAMVGVMAFMWVRQPQIRMGEFVTFMSDCSYGAYLIHIFVLALLGAPLIRLILSAGADLNVALIVMTAAVVGVTYVSSAAFHKLVELPGIALGKRLAVRKPSIARAETR